MKPSEKLFRACMINVKQKFSEDVIPVRAHADRLPNMVATAIFHKLCPNVPILTIAGFADRDHSSILWSIKRINEYFYREKKFSDFFTAREMEIRRVNRDLITFVNHRHPTKNYRRAA